MFAALPMYDWAGVRASTDALWSSIRDACRAAGLDAPDQLSRPFGAADCLRSDLLLAQICGMPYRLWLHDKVTLLGASDFGIAGCAPGFYRSHIIVRPGDPVRGKAAVNALHSQSGYAAMTKHLGPPAHFILTGSHAASIRAVANGQAGYAAIDALTWRHALREMPEARSLQVVANTEPTPGLPFISALHNDTELLQALIERAIHALAPIHRDALFLRGFVRFRPSDYF